MDFDVAVAGYFQVTRTSVTTKIVDWALKRIVLIFFDNSVSLLYFLNIYFVRTGLSVK